MGKTQTLTHGVYTKKIEAMKSEAGLSRQDIAGVVGASLRTVVRWATGQAEPRGPARERLLGLAAVIQYAGTVMNSRAIAAWLYTPNPLLDFERPVDLVRKGQYRDVMGSLQSLGEGVFV